MDNKIWIYIVFLVISLAYKAYKKNKEAAREEGLNPNPDNEGMTKKSNWGLGDLISQFEEKYNVESVPSKQESTNQYSEEHYDTYHPKSDYVSSDLDDTNISINTFDEKSESLHDKLEKEKKSAYDFYDSVDMEFDMELDLRQMVIHSAILNRPDY